MSTNETRGDAHGQAEQTCQTGADVGTDPKLPSTRSLLTATASLSTHPAHTEPTALKVVTVTSAGGNIRPQSEKSTQVGAPQSVSITTVGTSASSQNTAGSAVPKLSSVPVVAQAPSPPVLVVAKMPTPGGNPSGQPAQFPRPPPPHKASVIPTPARTVVITLPRTTAFPQPLTPRQPRAAATQLPANFQIPSGMVLIRSDSGQLMLVSQQALAQAQHGQRAPGNPPPRPSAPKVSAAAPSNKAETLTVIRMSAPSSVQPAGAQRTAVVKVNAVVSKAPVVQPLRAVVRQSIQPPCQAGVKEISNLKDPASTITPEVLENVKKCQNFLVTLIKLASSDSQSADMAGNVRNLVRSLLEGSLEPEEFTTRLYRELKSTPQPFLVPFLKKSLPAVRHLTSDPQLFIQQAAQPKQPASASASASATTPASANVRLSAETQKPVPLQQGGVTLRPVSSTARTILSEAPRATPRGIFVLPGHHRPGHFSLKQSLVQDLPPSSKHSFKESSASYKEDDDINDVASMAGVNLKEENAQILASGSAMVGSVVQSCLDTPFLSASVLLARILHAGKELGVMDVRSEVVELVSHATQERLRGLLEKLAALAHHRKAALKDDPRYIQVSAVRSQLCFLEEVECVKTQRREEEERERLLRMARSRSNLEDPQLQLLKQRAKELQQMEQAELQHREANRAALAAIGPRKKRNMDLTGNQVSMLARVGIQRVTRVTLRDLLLCMEQDRFLRHSVLLYKALLK